MVKKKKKEHSRAHRRKKESRLQCQAILRRYQQEQQRSCFSVDRFAAFPVPVARLGPAAPFIRIELQALITSATSTLYT